jgi:hypothetical protein
MPGINHSHPVNATGPSLGARGKIKKTAIDCRMVWRIATLVTTTVSRRSPARTDIILQAAKFSTFV